MRVCYDHQVTSLQDAGGISRYIFELAQALLATGEVQPDLVLGLERSVMPFRTLAKPARVFSLPAGSLRPGYSRYALNEAISTLVACTRGRYDVYHATYQRALPYVRRRVLVVTHHDSTPQKFPELFPDARAIRRRLDGLYAAADRILCISQSSRNDLLEFHSVDPAKTQVIYQGLSPWPWTEVDSSSSELLPGELCAKQFLLYVGARAAYKNFPVVLEALARQKDDELHLLVMGGGAFTAEEAAAIERLSMQRRVHIVARATAAQLAAAYRGARLLVYPSRYEGFGFPPLEAMQAGCPALVSRTAALPEVCGDAAFYFDPASADELVQMVNLLHSDDGLRLSKREAGFSQVRLYSWERTAQETLAAYRTALAGK